MIESASLYVHYYNRGVNKEAIFFSHLQYEYLIQTLYRFLPNYHLDLIAYCLMPNHYHILLKLDDHNQGSKYIQRVFNAFTQAVNHQVSRVGTLFQGNVKKRFIEDDEYLATVIMYIHLNPVKSGLCNKPDEWHYSDFQEWVGLKSTIRNIASERKKIFGNVEDYLELINMEIQNNLK